MEHFAEVEAALPEAIVVCALAGCGRTWQWTKSRRTKKFCSVKCGAVYGAQVNAIGKALETPSCADCGRQFTRKDGQKQSYCSRKCQNAAQYERARQRHGGDGALPSPYYTTIEPLRSCYEARCGMCGRQQGQDERLSHAELRVHRPLPRCSVCGGFVSLEPTEIRAIGSPSIGSKPAYDAGGSWQGDWSMAG